MHSRIIKYIYDAIDVPRRPGQNTHGDHGGSGRKGICTVSSCPAPPSARGVSLNFLPHLCMLSIAETSWRGCGVNVAIERPVSPKVDPLGGCSGGKHDSVPAPPFRLSSRPPARIMTAVFASVVAGATLPNMVAAEFRIPISSPFRSPPIVENESRWLHKGSMAGSRSVAHGRRK